MVGRPAWCSDVEVTDPLASKRPTLAITMGDPAGIGPEISVRAACTDAVRDRCDCLLVGDLGVFRRAAEALGTERPLQAVAQPEQAATVGDAVAVFDQASVDPAAFAWGRVSAMAGDAAFRAIQRSIELAMAGEVDAVVTAPIHKEALRLAGHAFAGHTEIFAHFTGTKDVTMMLAAGDLRVVHVSTHVSLRDACDRVRFDRVRRVIQLAHEACRRMGIARPHIGVAGLNPHASDGGLFGDEEARHIRPAIEDACAAGLDVVGPMPPDTFYAMAAGGAFDICVAMYHDQGHIPVKMKGFSYDGPNRRWTEVRGVNITLGLPIIRVSVDHGTAFDQAGQGTASDVSMRDAIDYALRMVGERGTT